MKKLLLLFLLVSATLRAEVYDAFKGFYPVTDKAFIKSLNGVWDIKVVDGIGQDPRFRRKMLRGQPCLCPDAGSSTAFARRVIHSPTR